MEWNLPIKSKLITPITYFHDWISCSYCCMTPMAVLTYCCSEPGWWIGMDREAWHFLRFGVPTASASEQRRCGSAKRAMDLMTHAVFDIRGGKGNAGLSCFGCFTPDTFTVEVLAYFFFSVKTDWIYFYMNHGNVAKGLCLLFLIVSLIIIAERITYNLWRLDETSIGLDSYEIRQ